MRKVLTVIPVALLITATALAAGPTYRWVDAEGRVHYSDRPHPDAELVKLPPAQTFQAPAAQPARPAAATSRPAPAPAAEGYTVLEVVSPTADEVLWNIAGELSIRLRLQPPLRSGHGIRLVYDGVPVEGLPETELALTLPEVYRGTHTLAASVIDDNGTEVTRSPAVTFHVRQNSIIRP